MAAAPERRPSLRQLARELGLSAAAVSVALRGAPGVSAATAARVRAAARARGYYPDPELIQLSRLMRAGRQPGFRSTLAFLNLFPQRDRADWEPYYGGLWAGARARAEELGYRIEPHWLHEPGLTVHRLSGIFAARGIKGILIPTLPDATPLPALDWTRFAGVALTDSPAVPHLTRVAPDNALAMAIALEAVARLGYRRPGLVAPPAFDVRTQHLHSGIFLRWLHERGLGAELLLPREPRADELREWIQTARPDVAIFPHPFPYAERWREAARALRIPPAFVNLAWAKGYRTYAGVDKCTPRIGSHGVDLLTAALAQGRQGLQVDPPTLRVPGRWEAGPSCPPAARRGPALRRLLGRDQPPTGER